MKPYLEDYSVINPETEAELAEALAEYEEAIPLAGGTDLFVSLKQGNISPTVFVNLKSCDDLDFGPELDGELVLSALTTFRDIRYNEEITDHYPLLHQAARNLSVIAVQGRATWAGNIVNASPCANGTAGLMVYDARLELAGSEGKREVELADFFSDYKQMDLNGDEYVRAIRVPRPSPGWKGYYRDVGARNFQAISKTLLTGRLKFAPDNTVDDIRLVAGSVAPHTLRLRETETVLRGEILNPESIETACDQLQEEISPIDDIRSNRDYRRRVTENMLREFLESQQPD